MYRSLGLPRLQAQQLHRLGYSWHPFLPITGPVMVAQGFGKPAKK